MESPQKTRSRFALLAEWLPFLVLALALHAALWLTAPPGLAVAPSRREDVRTTFAYMTVPVRDDRVWRDDLRALWSPVLFSVPTPMGFSAPMLSGSAELAPPENPDEAPPFLAPREKYVPIEPARDAASVLRAAALTLPVRVVASAAFPPGRVETNNMIHIMWTDARGVLRYQSVDVGNVAPWTDRKPWDAQALLELDEQGSARHVFLEKPTALKERNSALVRILSALRLDSAPAARTARITVRYDGAADAQEAVAKP